VKKLSLISVLIVFIGLSFSGTLTDVCNPWESDPFDREGHACVEGPDQADAAVTSGSDVSLSIYSKFNGTVIRLCWIADDAIPNILLEQELFGELFAWPLNGENCSHVELGAAYASTITTITAPPTNGEYRLRVSPYRKADLYSCSGSSDELFCFNGNGVLKTDTAALKHVNSFYYNSIVGSTGSYTDLHAGSFFGDAIKWTVTGGDDVTLGAYTQPNAWMVPTSPVNDPWLPRVDEFIFGKSCTGGINKSAQTAEAITGGSPIDFAAGHEFHSGCVRQYTLDANDIPKTRWTYDEEIEYGHMIDAYSTRGVVSCLINDKYSYDGETPNTTINNGAQVIEADIKDMVSKGMCKVSWYTDLERKGIRNTTLPPRRTINHSIPSDVETGYYSMVVGAVETGTASYNCKMPLPAGQTHDECFGTIPSNTISNMNWGRVKAYSSIFIEGDPQYNLVNWHLDGIVNIEKISGWGDALWDVCQHPQTTLFAKTNLLMNDRTMCVSEDLDSDDNMIQADGQTDPNKFSYYRLDDDARTGDECIMVANNWLKLGNDFGANQQYEGSSPWKNFGYPNTLAIAPHITAYHRSVISKAVWKEAPDGYINAYESPWWVSTDAPDAPFNTLLDSPYDLVLDNTYDLTANNKQTYISNFTGNVTFLPSTTESFGKINVRGGRTLTLKGGGTYIFNELVMESNSRLSIEDNATTPAYVYVKKLTHRGETINSHPDKLILTITGSSYTYIDREFKGTVVAPDVNLVLGQSSDKDSNPRITGTADFVGSFLANRIEVHQGTSVKHTLPSDPSCSAP